MQTAEPPVFDAAQLHRHTSGDPAMQVEVLALFANEVERLMRQIDDATDAQKRSDRVRALASLARTTGAAMLAHQARVAEPKMMAENPDLAPLRDAVATTLAFVRRSGI
jgi:hypothetical protein